MTENNNRVCCLYRVSTDKQVDFNSNHEADLPMQRKACHKFAESKGWVIVHEEQEEGVSGHKVRAAARDKLQIIKDYARKGKFDILLVFMFDRIGRIADETPFVAELHPLLAGRWRERKNFRPNPHQSAPACGRRSLQGRKCALWL